MLTRYEASSDIGRERRDESGILLIIAPQRQFGFGVSQAHCVTRRSEWYQMEMVAVKERERAERTHGVNDEDTRLLTHSSAFSKVRPEGLR